MITDQASEVESSLINPSIFCQRAVQRALGETKAARRLESASSLLVTRCDRDGEIIEMTCRRARHFDDQGNSYVVLLCDFRTS